MPFFPRPLFCRHLCFFLPDSISSTGPHPQEMSRRHNFPRSSLKQIAQNLLYPQGGHTVLSAPVLRESCRIPALPSPYTVQEGICSSLSDTQDAGRAGGLFQQIPVIFDTHSFEHTLQQIIALNPIFPGHIVHCFIPIRNLKIPIQAPEIS